MELPACGNENCPFDSAYRIDAAWCDRCRRLAETVKVVVSTEYQLVIVP